MPASRPGRIAVIILLIAAQALFVAAYLSHEHTIYFWDHAMYFAMARQAYTAFGQSFSAGLAMVGASLANDYNLLFALPSLLSFAVFGSSRLVFILTNFFVWFLFYEMAVALLLRRALGLRRSTALIVALGTSLFIPPLWLPLLEGYPDNGAAGCIVLAAALGWGGAAGESRIRRALLIGVALGAAVLLRRHFVYAAFPLLGTLACFEGWDIRRSVKNRGAAAWRAAIYLLLCGVGFGATLALVAPEFVHSALINDYGKLYQSYRRPGWVFLRFILGGFGIGLLLLAGDGLFLMARLGKAGQRLAAFVILYVLLWLGIWCLGPNQMGHHYILHAVPLFVALGLAGWFTHLSTRPAPRKYILGGIMLLGLAANSVWALWLSPQGVLPNDNGVPGLLSAARPPVIRKDVDEWQRLASHLLITTRARDRIMMVGSSFVFNLDLLNQIYLDMPEAAGMMARFPKNPEIDHEEPAPFDAFAGSDVYVVPSPPQYHLDPQGQRVITAAANQFPPPPSRTALFHADAETFHLEGGVTVNIWRRDPWTPAALFDALAEIRRDGPQDANFAQGWAATTLPLRERVITDANNTTSAAGLFDAQDRDMGLFFDYPLEQGQQRVVFSYAGTCGETRFHLAIITETGRTEFEKEFTPGPNGSVVAEPFTVANGDERQFLQLGLKTSPAALCRAALEALRVERVP